MAFQLNKWYMVEVILGFCKLSYPYPIKLRTLKFSLQIEIFR